VRAELSRLRYSRSRPRGRSDRPTDAWSLDEVIRGKFPFDRLKDKIIEMKEHHGRAASLVVEEDGISHGLIESLREKHINVVEYKPKGDKQERLISRSICSRVAPYCCLGRPHGSRRLLPSCCRFLAGTTIRGAGTRLATRGMEGAASSAKSNRNGRLNHCPVWSIKIRDL